MNQVIDLNAVVTETRDTFNAVRIADSMVFEREAEFALQQLFRNEFTLKVARANAQSVRDAVANVAAIGLTLNPALRLAYLVPRDGAICLDIGYLGLVQLALDGGSIRWVRCELVREKDSFEFTGPAAMPVHRFNPFGADRGPVVGVYCVAKTSDGDILADVMEIGEVHRIRDRSQSWKSGKASPWKTDEGEMTKKTLIKRASKLWPKCDRLMVAANYLNTVNGEGFGEVTDVEPKQLAQDLIPQERFDELSAELQDIAAIGALETFWKELTKDERKALANAKDEAKNRIAAADKAVAEQV